MNFRERTQDTFGFWRERRLDPESNVQFGEGGAGTFSDGKLHTQIRDPKHYGRKVLSEFVKAGAPEEILYIGKPHIGTFRLVRIIEQMRKDIIALGGEFRFMSRVDDLLIENGQIKGVILSNGETILSDHVVLAPGHSARDTFDMLYRRGIQIEAKPFSIGFRIEHPQSMIDRCRLGPNAGNPLLGAADYKLVHHCKNGRSVYSFCMCPGGTVVAAASEPGRLVTNGMSQYSRNERNANAAIVVDIRDIPWPVSHSSGNWNKRHSNWAAPTTMRPASSSVIFSKGDRPHAWVPSSRLTNPASHHAIFRRHCPITPSKPCARPFPPLSAPSRDSRLTMPYSPVPRHALRHLFGTPEGFFPFRKRFAFLHRGRRYVWLR